MDVSKMYYSKNHVSYTIDYLFIHTKPSSPSYQVTWIDRSYSTLLRPGNQSKYLSFNLYNMYFSYEVHSEYSIQPPSNRCT